MKLYTEEQLLNTMQAVKDYLDNQDKQTAEETLRKHVKALEPIELPSVYADGYSEGYNRALELVKWNIDELQGGNK